MHLAEFQSETRIGRNSRGAAVADGVAVLHDIAELAMFYIVLPATCCEAVAFAATVAMRACAKRDGKMRRISSGARQIARGGPDADHTDCCTRSARRIGRPERGARRRHDPC